MFDIIGRVYAGAFDFNQSVLGDDNWQIKVESSNDIFFENTPGSPKEFCALVINEEVITVTWKRTSQGQLTRFAVDFELAVPTSIQNAISLFHTELTNEMIDTANKLVQYASTHRGCYSCHNKALKINSYLRFCDLSYLIVMHELQLIEPSDVYVIAGDRPRQYSKEVIYEGNDSLWRTWNEIGGSDSSS